MQNTGNPVLDSFVNLATNMPVDPSDIDQLEKLHAMVLKLADKEPGGLANGRPAKIGTPA